MDPIDRVGLPPERLAAIRAALAGQAILADVVRWGARAEPPRMIVDVVVQDEYTHDVVLDHGDGLFLVYDTT
ncbi:MAG: hypothetical protein KC420_19195 [Myxococcales bacterium]|nr:hypothetical protein [Myxococcales bacterium]MCB9706840.1 hypothetical protein [Myxococcales bacterium]